MVERELQPAERIIWMEQPMPGRYARSMWPIVLFGVPWTAFAVFWTVGAGIGTMRSNAPGIFSVFPLFGLPFVLIGIGMLSSPWWARRSARRSVYVITDRRAIIFRSGWRGAMNVRSFEPAHLTDLQRKQYQDGSGDLILARDYRRDSDGDRMTTNVGFIAVRDAKAVEEMVRALSRRPTPSPQGGASAP